MKQSAIIGFVFTLLIAAACQQAPPPPPPAAPEPPPTMDLTTRDQMGHELRPFVKLNLKSHSEPIMRMVKTVNEQFIVTVSLDKSVKIWSLPGLNLEKTYYIPVGTGNVSKLYSVAVSPDGQTIAVGGWLTAENSNDVKIYLLDFETGRLLRTLDGLEDIPTHLCYDPQGKYLAAVLNNANGLRVWDRSAGYRLAAEDKSYGDDSYFCEFSKSGRLVTSSYDGYVRIYSENLQLQIRKKPQGGNKPFFTPFSPDERFIAVGFTDTTAVEVYSANIFDFRYALNTQTVQNGDLGRVAWSHDSFFLFAGGRYKKPSGGRHPVLVWREAGRGRLNEIGSSYSTVMGIVPLRSRSIIVGSQDPSIYAVDDKGATYQNIRPETPDYNILKNTLGVSEAGDAISYNYRYLGQYYRAYFNVQEETLGGNLPDGAPPLNPPRLNAADVSVKRGNAPGQLSLNGASVPLDNDEIIRCLTVSKDGTLVAVGGERTLRLFNSEGIQTHTIVTNGSVHQINISGNGQWVVAALSDGTIRWYSASSGNLALTYFMSLQNSQWVLFTPDNNYMTSQEGENLISWQQNIPNQMEATVYPTEKYKAYFNKPEKIKELFF